MTNFLTGAITGTLILMIALTVIPNSMVYKYQTEMEICEKSLPRDQTCKIVAIRTNKY